MVKYSTSRSRLLQIFQNLNGFDTTLKIDKQGRCLWITFEQKFSTHFYRILLYFAAALITLFVIYCFLGDTRIIKVFTGVVLVVLLYEVLTTVYEESVCMVHSLGFQITNKSLMVHKDLFIPWNQVQSIFINEVIVRHKVIHLLTILTKEQEGEKLIPLFLEMQPRLQHLELINKYLKSANS